jgi:hypothetical protein
MAPNKIKRFRRTGFVCWSTDGGYISLSIVGKSRANGISSGMCSNTRGGYTGKSLGLSQQLSITEIILYIYDYKKRF